MENQLQINLLKNISYIYDESKKCKHSDSFFKKISPKLEELALYFEVTKNQAFLISLIFVFNYKGDCVDINDLGAYLDCNPVKLLEYHKDLTELAQKRILKKHKSKHRFIAIANDQFALNEDISTAIIMNKSIPELKRLPKTDIIEVLQNLYAIGQDRDEDKISTIELFEEMNNIIKLSEQFTLIQTIKHLELENADKYLLFYIIWKTVTGIECSDLVRTVRGIFDSEVARVFYAKKLLSKENELQNKGLVEITESSFFHDSEIKLTDYGSKLLLTESLNVFSTKKKLNNVITPSKIEQKQLFYNKKEQQQFDMLIKMLNEDNLKQIQTRLASKVLSTGVSVLLYGAPGTGKTETVYQIAKQTNREVIKVDISNSKSVWYGESEKKIKRIFTEYNDYLKHSEICPILLFNEADAIISKRKENGLSNVDQTENTIQNILLEELENFKGIFFATTNLIKNFDSAFDRRFLFKIELFKPDLDSKVKIWKSKCEKLELNDCKTLASNFDLTGGQIDNIIRKISMSEIVNGKDVNFNEIINFCENEKLNGNIKIGFKEIFK